jgi:uridine phosphorylase
MTDMVRDTSGEGKKKVQGAITARDVLAGKGLDSSTFHFPIAIAFYFKGMADLPWWQPHGARFGAKRINHPLADDSTLHWGKVISTCPISIWNIETEGVPIIFVGPLLYGPWGAAALEELKVFGLEYVIGVGAAGAFSERLRIGDILIADQAIVSDGASKAYTDEPIVHPSPFMQSLAEETFRRHELPVNHTCVWQSDAIYRESLEAREDWRRQGAECVNVETSTLYAVSNELGIQSVSLNWITDSTVSGAWTGWGKQVWHASGDGQPVPPPRHDSPLVVMEDVAIDMAREIKRTRF